MSDSDRSKVNQSTSNMMTAPFFFAPVPKSFVPAIGYFFMPSATGVSVVTIKPSTNAPIYTKCRQKGIPSSNAARFDYGSVFTDAQKPMASCSSSALGGIVSSNGVALVVKYSTAN